MKKYLGLYLAAIVVLGACSTTRFTQTEDKFTGEKSVESEMTKATTVEIGTVSVGFKKSQAKESATKYKMTVAYVSMAAKKNVEIKKGDSLLLLVDGKKLALSSDESSAEKSSKLDAFGVLWYTDRASYNVSEADLLAIARAHTVDFRILTEWKPIEGKLTNSNLQALNEFNKQYLGSATKVAE